jgi:hypothetical protein
MTNFITGLIGIAGMIFAGAGSNIITAVDGEVEVELRAGRDRAEATRRLGRR